MEELLLSRERHNDAIVCLGLVQKVIYVIPQFSIFSFEMFTD